MAVLIGIALALGVAVFARVVGFDRDRAFYPVVLTVIASYYVLFAVMAGAGAGLCAELGFFALFAGLAVAGFRGSLWIVVAGLALHGAFDFVRDPLLAGEGVPAWWPGFCLGYDLAAALALAALLVFGKRGTARD